MFFVIAFFVFAFIGSPLRLLCSFLGSKDILRLIIRPPLGGFLWFFYKKRYFDTIYGASKIGANSPGRSMRHTPTLGKCLYAFRERFWPSRTCFRCQLHNGAKIQAKNVQYFFHFRKNTLFLEEFGAISSKLLYMVFKCLKIISPRLKLSGDSFWWSEDLLQTF